MIRLTLALPMITLPMVPALAHPGDHDHMSPMQIIQHHAEPDHLAFLALAAIVGWLGYRLGLRHGARVEAGAAAKRTKP